MNRAETLAEIHRRTAGRGRLVLNAEELAALRATRLRDMQNLEPLATQAADNCRRMMAQVYRAETAPDALAYIDGVARGQVVKSYSATLAEIGLVEHLRARGITVTETRLADFLAAAWGLVPLHPLQPLAHLPEGELAEMLRRSFSFPARASLPEMLEAARQELTAAAARADVGITGASAVVAETGSVLLLEEEGNARLVSNLPPVHVVVAGLDKLYASGEEALHALRAASLYGAGKPLANYLSFISGPSKTGDIAFQMVKGVHGPQELHVVLLDNGRRAAVREGYAEVLTCVGCGACLTVCPVYAREGPAYGHRYQGGRGLLFTAFHAGLAAARAHGLEKCERCGRCRETCPLGIDVPALVGKLLAET